MKKCILPILPAVFLFACSTGGGDDTDTADSLLTDTAMAGVSVQDTAEDTASLTVTEEEPLKEELRELPADKFCECVKQQQALNRKLEKAETDAEFDAVLAEMDVLENGECKNMLAGNQSTVSQRAEHQQKVAECLSN